MKDTEYPLGFKIITKLGRARYILIYTSINYIFMGLWSLLEHRHAGYNSYIPEIIPIIIAIVIFIIAIRYDLTKNIRLILMGAMFIGSLLGIVGTILHIQKWQHTTAPYPNLSPLIYIGLMGVGLTAFIFERKEDRYAIFCPKYFNIPLFLKQNQIFGLVIGIGFLWVIIISIYYHYPAIDHPAKKFATLWGFLSFIISIWAFRKKNLTFKEAMIFLFFMILDILIGLGGFIHHILYAIKIHENLIKALTSMPILAPLMFSDMGLLGIIYLLLKDKGCEDKIDEPAY